MKKPANNKPAPAKPIRGLTPVLREFVELRLSGMTLEEAWCTAKGIPKSKSAGVCAARAWNTGQAVLAYRKELEERARNNETMAGAQASLEKAAEGVRARAALLEAAGVSRAQLVSYLAAVVFTPPTMLFKTVGEAEDGQPWALNEELGHLAQGFKITRGGLEVTMPNKINAARFLAELMGWVEEPDTTTGKLASAIERLAKGADVGSSPGLPA